MKKSDKLLNILIQLPYYERYVIISSLQECTIDILNRRLYSLQEGGTADTSTIADSNNRSYETQKKYGRRGAALGAMVGAGGALASYVLKKKRLNEKLKKCDSLKDKSKKASCKEQVKKEIKDLNKKMLAIGLGTTLAGTGAGFGVGRLAGGIKDDPRNIGGGAAIGASIMGGALAIEYLKEMDILKKKYRACLDDECKKYVKKEMKDLRKEYLLKGMGASALGAGGGALVGKYGRQIANTPTVQKVRGNVQRSLNTVKTKVGDAVGDAIQGAGQRLGAGLRQGMYS